MDRGLMVRETMISIFMLMLMPSVNVCAVGMGRFHFLAATKAGCVALDSRVQTWL